MAVDLRGHGDNAGLGEPFGLPDLADDLWETVDRAGAPRADVLWGHSLGALVALEAVRRRPDGAARLVLEDPPGPESTDAREVADGVQRDVAAAREDLAGFLAGERRSHPDWADGDLDARADVARCDVGAVTAALERGLLPDLVALLAATPVPALLVLGNPERGSMVSGSERARVRATLPPHDVVEFDAGHCVHRERFEDYLATTTAWLART
jgi:pimeloyl-ACP methyl ester carboxylesterase